MSDHYKHGPYVFDPPDHLEHEDLKRMLDESVRDGLNDIMPTVMEEIEGLVASQISDVKADISNIEFPDLPTQPQQLTYTHGLRIGFAIGACLFIGLLAGLLIGKI